MACITLRVSFLAGETVDFPVHEGGDWFYSDQPDRVIVRPFGKGVPRHEIPLRNIQSIMVIQRNAVDDPIADVVLLPEFKQPKVVI